jgi:hypothetical protein
MLTYHACMYYVWISQTLFCVCTIRSWLIIYTSESQTNILLLRGFHWLPYLNRLNDRWYWKNTQLDPYNSLNHDRTAHNKNVAAKAKQFSAVKSRRGNSATEWVYRKMCRNRNPLLLYFSSVPVGLQNTVQGYTTEAHPFRHKPRPETSE